MTTTTPSVKKGVDHEDGVSNGPDSSHPVVQQFFKSRHALIEEEKSRRSDFAFRQSLSPIAREACKIVSALRSEEQRTIWADHNELFSGMMFNMAKSRMETTKLWRIVKRMPKGTLLHCHLGAMVDLEWVFDKAITTPGMCFSAATPLDSTKSRQSVSVQFEYSSKPVADGPVIWSPEYVGGTLVSVAEAAETFPESGKAGFVSWMKNRCSITQEESLQHHLGVDDVWQKLQGGFVILGPIIYYEPIMRAFLWKFFETLVEDGIRWVEIRAVFSTPFTREGSDTPTDDFTALIGVINEVVESFKAVNNFWGARLIWTTMRFRETAHVAEDMKRCLTCKQKYPDLIAGYDLVGQEDLGRTLEDLAPEILWFRRQCNAMNLTLPFLFHAGECLGDGDSTDQNLFDAILFNSRRIGHGFSLFKHPTLIDQVKEKHILVESCPISNEVLRLTASILSHPLPALLSRGVAASLSNDDPALLGQETSGLTHDFWQALQGWENLGLAGLGSLAQNSMQWAAFDDQNDDQWLRILESGDTGESLNGKRMREWAQDWEKFCIWVVEEFGPTSGCKTEVSGGL